MSQFVRNLLGGVFSLFLLFTGIGFANAQMFNPNDPIVVYNPANPPTQPANGQVGKWVKTNRLSWNTSSFKSYIYKGIPFRLKYPKNYVPGDGKKYPLFLFFHGVGERGAIYDNEYQLYHGGKLHMDAVNNLKYDGFLLYPQCYLPSGVFSLGMRNIISELITDFLIPQAQVDPFRIQVNGLSGGGASSWAFLFENPTLVSAALPMSNASTTLIGDMLQNKYTPIWLFQGALDTKPLPGSGRGVNKAAVEGGANFRYTEYPDRGHDTWSVAWKEPDFHSFMIRAHKANPWPLFGRTSFCASEPINVKIGVTPGFAAYEWRKDGDLIAGASSNEITATAAGVYDCRINNGTEWSVWSPTPVNLVVDAQPVSPNITLGTFGSKVLPSPDGKTSIKLVMPEGFYAYRWEKIGTSGAISTTSSYEIATPGDYRARVSQSAVCVNAFSPIFSVINANGPNKPDPVANLIVNKQSRTSLRLDWITNPNASYPATNFEIYQATKAGGPYQFVGITPASQLTFTKEALTPGEKYYFVVRAVNNSAASALSTEVSATTDFDNIPPTAPLNLKVVGTTRNSVSLIWDGSEDETGLDHYDIYVNGEKAFNTTETEYTVYNLDPANLYTFSVKAQDISGNSSAASNQVSAKAIMKGLRYKYYLGEWDLLPDFSKLTPTKTGFVPNISLANRSQEENYAYMWEGDINLSQAGTYTFRTNSDDGSKLYFDVPYSTTSVALVDNDGLHGTQNQDGSVTVSTPGIYKIIVTFFQKGGGSSITVSWRTPSNGNFVTIPNSAFAEAEPGGGGAVPNKPSGMAATTLAYNRISLSWTDNSNNESSFEVFRSENAIEDFTTVAVVPANTTAYIDTTVLPATKYFYKVRAINQFGQSAFDKEGRGISYSYYETNSITNLPDFNALIPDKTGRSANFALGMQNRNANFAVKFDGIITVPTTGTYNFSLTSDDGSKLYIGGFSEANRVINLDAVRSSAATTSANKTLNAGSHPITVTYFTGATGNEALSLSYRGPTGSGISQQVVPVNVLGEEPASATTQAAPPAPAAPTGLDAFGFSPSVIKLVWVDNAAGNASKYEVYRSYLNNEDFVLYTSLPGTAASFTDTALYPNSLFFYKVRAVGIGGESAFSNEDSTKTFGMKPVLNAVENQYMRFGTQLQVPVSIAAVTSDPISVEAFNLPGFGTFVSTGNGKGLITFNPSESQQGVYSNILVKAANNLGDTSSISFSLVVNSNHVPEIGNITNVTLNEKENVVVNVTATDLDAGDQLIWTFLNLPSFVNVSDTNRVAKLVIAPNYSQAGTYKVTARVEDRRNGKDTVSFIIQVNPTQLVSEKIFVNFNDGSTLTVPPPGPGSKWNNTNKAPTAGSVFSNLKNDKGVNTGVSITVQSSGITSINYGMNTGNNSGVYPDSVLISQYRFTGGTKNFLVSSLNPNARYNFTFMGSSNVNGTIPTEYSINGQTVSLHTAKNTQNTVTISNVVPAANGTLTFSVTKPASNPYVYSYINALVIERTYDDSTLPAKPKDFVAKFEDDVVKLSWTNVAFNATTYEVYRANNLVGPFVLLNPGVTDSELQSYEDNTIVGNKAYYYLVRAKNSHGGSNTQTIKVVIPNKSPVFNNLADIFVKSGQTNNVNIKAVDDVADVITLVASGLPSFATFTDNGAGNGVLAITPAANNKGVFHGITVTATDNNGGSTSESISIYITDQGTASVYVNFNLDNPVGGIWNNFSKSPSANASITALKNDLGTTTTVGVTLLDAWQAASSTGAVTGNNTGIYRDDVLQTLFSEGRGTTNRIRISGLSTDPSKRYNLRLVASVDAPGLNRSTLFSVGTKRVTINAASNVENLAQINDLTADENGVIEFTVARGYGSSLAYINALVIDEYTASVTLLGPENLRGIGASKDSIRLTWLNRADGSTTEIYRATSANGTYNLVGTADVGVNIFGDAGLAENTEYFYKVLSVKSGESSSFSNITSASTFAFSVYININREDPAGLPWNNTNSVPELGVVYQNLYSDKNNYSGINMEVVEAFSGDNPFGENTGDSSGVVPDNVMRSSWWRDASQPAQLKFSGLSQNMRYSFWLFGSREGTQVRTTKFTINGRSVKLRVSSNRTEAVIIDNVKADENGEVFLIVEGSGSSGYINGLIISPYKTPSISVESEGGETFRVRNNTANTATGQNNSIIAPDASFAKSKLEAYPNPFTDDVMIKLSLANSVSKLVVKVIDASGNIVMSREFSNVSKGTWQQAAGLNNRHLPPGIYMIQVQGLNGEKLPPIRMLKTR